MRPMNLFHAVLLFTIATAPLCAQGYYPLELGNIWQYWDCYDSSFPYQVQSVADTLMPNGNKYTVIQSVWDTLYLRQDSTRVLSYSVHRLSDTTYLHIEEIWFDFSKSTGDTIEIRPFPPRDTILVTVVYDRFRSVFGRIRRQWGFYERSLRSSMYILREVTDSLGLTRLTYEPGLIVDCLRGAIINGIKYGTVTSMDYEAVALTKRYELSQNYPNPFNGTTTIELTSTSQRVSVIVFDALGNEIKHLFEGKISTGRMFLQWDGTNDRGESVTSGLYVCRLRTNAGSEVRKMMLVR